MVTGTLRTLVFVSVLVLLGSAIREVLIYLEKIHAKKILLSERKVRANFEQIEVSTKDFLRGDFEVQLRKPPFQPCRWIINTVTGQVFSEQSKKSEDSFLGSLR